MKPRFSRVRRAPALSSVSQVSSLFAYSTIVAFAACASDNNTSEFGTNGDGGPTSPVSDGAIPDIAFNPSPGEGGADVSGPPVDNTPPVPFSATPIIGMGAPTNAPDLFGADAGGGTGGGDAPCVLEPEGNALFPHNWLRPRINVKPTGGQNLFEIRFHADGAASDQLVYSADTAWYMPKGLWKYLASLVGTTPLDVTVTIRGAVQNGGTLTTPPSAPVTVHMAVAPADAGGSIVYWTTTDHSALKGFVVGDENVGTVLTPPQVQMKSKDGQQIGCIGCHTSTPDGDYASFDTQEGGWALGLGSVQMATTGRAPPYLGAGGIAALTGGTRGIHSYSKAHFAAGDRVAITPMEDKLAWIDLEAVTPGQGMAYDFLARNGDGRKAGAPTWSHDGKTVVYVSTDALQDGRLSSGDADLFAVPYMNRAGGDAAAIPGASDADFEEYYPTFSADDKLLAYNRIPKATNMYNQGVAEVYVIPASGGTGKRVDANDPTACSGRMSPGVTNSWPKWSPEALTVGGSTYYWMIFSSTRDEKGNPQLYVTGVVADAAGALTTHGAIYLWNQPEDENNHTPAWDVFKIPPAPPPPHVH